MTLDAWSAIYQAQLSRYQAIVDADNNIDTKGGVLLGAILAVSAFALNRGLFSTDNKLLFALLILGIATYTIALGILVFILRPQLYRLPANTTKEHPDYLSKPDEDLMYQLIVDAEYSADEIEGKLSKKSLFFTIATALFVLGTLILLVIKLIAGETK